VGQLKLTHYPLRLSALIAAPSLTPPMAWPRLFVGTCRIPRGGLMGEGLFQPLHLLLIIAIILLIFGTSKFSALGKGMGEGIRNFKAAMKEGEEPKKEKEEEKKS
jgi:sec-independent protein translocase protein TatA